MIKKSGFRSIFEGCLPLFVLAHLAHHLVTALPVPLLPFIRDDFGLDYMQAGLVISAFGVVYGISQLPAGWLADRIGARRLITIGIIGVAVTGILAGLSQSYLMLIVFLALMGILGGGYHPAATTTISAIAGPKTLGRAMGFHMMGGSGSFFLVPLIAAALAAAWGWRGTFIAIAIPTIIFGIILHIMLRRQTAARETAGQTTADYAESPPPPGYLRRLLPVMVISTFTQAVILSVVSFIPLYLVDIFGTGKEAAAASISLVYAVGLVAGPMGGYLSDRFGRVTMIGIACFTAVAAIFSLNLASYGIGTGALLVIIGIVIYINTTSAQAFIVDNTPSRKRSTMLGVYFFGTMEGNGILTPVIGYLIDRFGFYTSFGLTSGSVLAVTLAGFLFFLANRNR
ncbi:MAG: MFS transporter [Dehalococcoidales bacterium]